MPWVGKPHWRHEARIYIYALTLPTFSMPHSSLPPWNPNRTLSQQIVRMPSTRIGRRYSARPSMPSSPTLIQGSYVSSPFSTTSNSVLRGPLTDDENKSLTSLSLNMVQSSMTMMTMKILWQYSSHKVICIPEPLLCNIYGSLHKN